MPFNVLDVATAAAAFSSSDGEPLTSVGETLLSLREKLLEQLANRDDVTPERLDKWINWGYANIAGMVDLKELRGSAAVSLVTDQPLYALPVQVAAAMVLSLQDEEQVTWEGRELTLIDLAKYRMLPEDTATPTSWFRWRRMLVVWPTPDAAFTAALEFRVRPDPLVEDTDSPLLPPEFHEALLLSARHRAFRSLQEYKQAQQAMNDMLVCMRPLLDAAAEERGVTRSSTYAARTESQLHRSHR